MKLKWWLIGAAGVLAAVLVAVVVLYELNLQPANKLTRDPIAFAIAPGERLPNIVKHLSDAGIIKSRWAFSVYVTLHGLRRQIQAGYYELSPADSAATNAKIIAHGIVVNKAFLIPEGATIKQIEDRATQDWLRGGELPAALAETNYEGDFLATRPAGATLEGYLFPDTYLIAPSTTPHQLVQSMLHNFGRKVTPEVQAGLAKQGFNLHQGLTLASIVEKEVSAPADQKLVAQVFLNRLHRGMMLESSVTAFYGASLQGLANVTEANLRSVNSPYNTYLHAGLPPGPISNPGLGAINAVISPTPNDYLYFVTDKNGKVYYARTYAEHQANVAKYMNQ